MASVFEAKPKERAAAVVPADSSTKRGTVQKGTPPRHRYGATCVMATNE